MPRTFCAASRVINRGPGGGADSRAAAPLVSQHVVVDHGAARHVIQADDRPWRTCAHAASGAWRAMVVCRRRWRRGWRARWRCCSRRTRRTRRGCLIANATPCVKDGIHDAVIHGRRDRIDTHQGSKAAAHVRASSRPADPSTCASGYRPRHHHRSPEALPFVGFDDVIAARRREADEFYDHLQARITRPWPGPQPRRRSDGGAERRRAGAAAGVRGIVVVEAVLSLRRAPLARRRSGAARAAAERRQGRNRAWSLHLRHADIILDAGHLGVSLVRLLGPRLPRRRHGDDRSGIREAAARAADAADHAASLRRGAGVRVGLRCDESARAGVGGVAGLSPRSPPSWRGAGDGGNSEAVAIGSFSRACSIRSC